MNSVPCLQSRTVNDPDLNKRDIISTPSRLKKTTLDSGGDQPILRRPRQICFTDSPQRFTPRVYVFSEEPFAMKHSGGFRPENASKAGTLRASTRGPAQPSHEGRSVRNTLGTCEESSYSQSVR